MPYQSKALATLWNDVDTALIDNLPDELLCNIFTLSNEVHLDFRSDIGLLKYSPGMYTTKSHGRRMKPTTQMICRVSRRWNRLVHLQGNGHLWIAAAVLSCDEDDAVTQFATFRQILRDSRQCDLDVVWL